MPEKEIPPTVREALARSVRFLEERGVPSPRLDAELLLAEALGLDRLKLVLDPGRILDPSEEKRFGELVRRRGEREPLQYILGRQEFWSLSFPVDRRVLIPRPETELVVEAALEAARGLEGTPLFIDMGCGCGTIAVALASRLPAARIVAVDASKGAAECARVAAERHGVADRVWVVCADLFTALREDVQADIIVSNPPYIATEAIDTLQPEVSRYEPREALDGGRGGLEVISRFVADAAGRLKGGAKLIFEAAGDQAGEIGRIIASSDAWRRHRIINDYAGIARVHVVERA